MFPSTFQFSQGKLQDFSDCKRRFYLRYIKNLSWPAAIVEPLSDYEALTLSGSIFHKLIQQYYLGIPLEILSQSTKPELLHQWWENFLEFGPKVNQLVDDGARFFPEITLSAAISDKTIVAKYDLIIIHPRKDFIIFDWKTSQFRPDQKSLLNRWQTKIYQFIALSCSQELSIITGMHIHQPPRLIYWFSNFPDQPVIIDYSRQQYESDLLLIEATINQIVQLSTQGEDMFPLTNNLKVCKYCNFRSLCDRGIEAGSIFDDYLDDELFSRTVGLEQISEAEF